MAERVLVTGTAGFIGNRLAAGLHRAGHPITAVDRRPATAAIGAGCEVRVADFRAPEILAEVRDGRYAAVVHQAAVSNTLATDWSLLQAVNVAGTLALADACAAGGARFVYASSFSVYGQAGTAAVNEDAVASGRCSGPLNLYAKSKLAADRALVERPAGSLRWYGLRYTNVFGPDEELAGRASSIISQIVDRAARGRPIRLFADTLLAARDYVPIEAVLTAVAGLLAGDAPSGCYNVGAGRAVPFGTLLQWCAEFRGEAGLEVRLVPNPIPDRYQYWTQADTSRLRRVLPAYPALDVADVRAVALRRFLLATRSEEASR